MVSSFNWCIHSLGYSVITGQLLDSKGFVHEEALLCYNWDGMEIVTTGQNCPWDRYLTPHSWVTLATLMVTQLVKKFPVLHGLQRFITMFTRAHQWTLSRTSWIQSTHLLPISLWYILILSSHLHWHLPSGLFPLGFLAKILYALLTPPCTLHVLSISYSSISLP
jgi:hypothetical protein